MTVYFLVFNLPFFSAYYQIMSLIVPQKSNSQVKAVDKHFLDNALKDLMQTTITDEEGVAKSIAERMAYGLVMDALYAETVKDRTTCKKLIYERVGGKPTVIPDEEKEDLPEVVFRVSANDAQKIKALQEMPVEEDDSEDKVIVEIEDEPRMEF